MKANLPEDQDMDNEVAGEHGVLEEQVRDPLHCHRCGCGEAVL